MSIIDAIHEALNSQIMFALWLFAFLVILAKARATGQRDLLLLALACVPMCLYFLWAWSGIWRSHETALAFNRSAQIVSLVILIGFAVGNGRSKSK